MSESVAFILCTERGPLEQMSALFASSLSRFGGSLSDAPVYSYAPRIGHDVGSRTRKHFATLEVNHLIKCRLGAAHVPGKSLVQFGRDPAML